MIRSRRKCRLDRASHQTVCLISGTIHPFIRSSSKSSHLKNTKFKSSSPGLLSLVKAPSFQGRHCACWGYACQIEQHSIEHKVLALVLGDGKYHNYRDFKGHFYDNSDLFNQKTEAMLLKKKQQRKPTQTSPHYSSAMNSN